MFRSLLKRDFRKLEMNAENVESLRLSTSMHNDDINLQEEVIEVYCEEISTCSKDADPDYEEEKCGNVLISKKGTYVLVCEFCTDRFDDLSSFGAHIEAKHLISEGDEFNSQEICDLKIEVDGRHLSDGEYSDGNEYPIEYAEVPGDTVFQTYDKDVQNLGPESCDYSLKKNLKKFRKAPNRKRERKKHVVPLNESDGPIESTELTAPSALKDATKAGVRSVINHDLCCDICGQHFKMHSTFRKHAVTRHGNEIPKPFQEDPSYLKCQFCHEPFETPVERAAHENTHNEDTPFKCSYCTKWFRVKYQRDIHENTHNGTRPYKCPYCPKAFKSYINRVQHIRSHLNIKRFECEYCGFKFVTNVEKSIHVRIHTNEKPYQCEDCGERFRVSGQLHLHRKKHKDQRDCECDVCGAKFFSNYSVKIHKVLHTDERPFECEICGRKFPRKRTLAAHRQLHDPVKKYQCYICDKKFAQSAGLHSHMKSHGEKAIEV